MERDEGGFEGEHWGPVVLEDVEADGTGCGGDVGVVDLGDELHLDGLEGVGFGYYDILAEGERHASKLGTVACFEK